MRIYGLCLFILLNFAVQGVLLPSARAERIPEANIGYRSLVTWLPGDRIQVEIAVWYPTERTPNELKAGSWSFTAARNAPPIQAPWPLIIISHDSAGSRFAHHDLAAALARRGSIVAALTHDGDNIDDMALLFSARQLPFRARQISASLDMLLESPEFGSLINQKNIALIGFGNGGTAGLLLAGARLTTEFWPSYCDDENGLPYCEPDMRHNMDTLVASIKTNLRQEELARQNRELAVEKRNEALAQGRSGVDKAYPRIMRAQKRPAINFPKPPVFLPLLPPLQENPPLTDNRFRAMILVSPGYSMLFDRESLKAINLPMLIMGAEKDAINIPDQQAQRLRGFIAPPTPEYVLLKDADMPSLQALCPPDIAATMPDLCHTVTPQKRALIHSQMEKSILYFLQGAFRPSR